MFDAALLCYAQGSWLKPWWCVRSDGKDGRKGPSKSKTSQNAWTKCPCILGSNSQPDKGLTTGVSNWWAIVSLRPSEWNRPVPRSGPELGWISVFRMDLDDATWPGRRQILVQLWLWVVLALGPRYRVPTYGRLRVPLEYSNLRGNSLCNLRVLSELPSCACLAYLPNKLD
jgi:hypothetical protein